MKRLHFRPPVKGYYQAGNSWFQSLHSWTLKMMSDVYFQNGPFQFFMVVLAEASLSLHLLIPGNDRRVTPHSIDQSKQFRFRALRSIEDQHIYDFHSKQFSSVTLIWMIKYVQNLIITWIITSHLESFYRHN